MSKRFRLLIILVLIGVFLMFLLPTIRWHLLISEDEKLLATSTNEQIKRYAEKEAGVVVTEIMGMIENPFTVDDLKNSVGLLKKLNEATDKVSQLVKEGFSEEGKALIKSYSEGMELDSGQKELLVTELNRIIHGKLIYSDDVFGDVELSRPTLERAIREAKGLNKDRIGKHAALNRFLLEESFPGELHAIYLPDKYAYLIAPVKEYYKSIKVPVPEKMTVKAVLNSFSSRIDMLEVIADHYREEVLNLKKIRESSITLGLDLRGGIKVTTTANFDALPEERRPTKLSEREEAVSDALEILNSRIDRFGITEPEIMRQGEDQIIISLPGLADPERIKSIILGKGRLNFHIVDEEGVEAFNTYYSEHPTDFLREGDKLELKDPDILPPGTILCEVVEKDKYGIDQRTGYTVLKEEIGLEGKYITNAITRTDPRTLQPNVIFELDAEGTEIFDKFTNENVKKQLAVVLDDNVKFQATIKERISGGSVNVAGFGSNPQEASDLARVLKTGALPVPLEISAQEAVGATLGADSVSIGVKSVILGLILVFVFMLFYYLEGGIISSIALILNFYFLAATLSVFNFTLTLPSIASFILTVGMAVDANVIIFERIKEEYKLGKSRKASVKAGFSKAFQTIMDANVTTAIAALALAYFGKGSIKGFAVVLVTGIVSSMFTALFVSRLLFDFVTDVFKTNKLSLSWKRGGHSNE